MMANRESRIRRGAVPIALAVAAALACVVPTEDAVGRTVQASAVPADTIPEVSGGKFMAAVAVEIAPPPEEGRAAAYAERYRISKELALKIIESAKAEGIDPELGFRLVRVESVFKPNARGRAGALGLTQLMPSTARAIDRSLRTEAQILEPETNLRTGFKYLRQMIQRYGDVRLGVLAYNRGETAVDRALRAGRDPENGYSPKVLSLGGDRYAGTGLLKE